MRLFTCKKYDFLIEKNLPSLFASTPTQKYRVGTKFHRGFVVIPTDLSSDPILVGKVMLFMTSYPLKREFGNTNVKDWIPKVISEF